MIFQWQMRPSKDMVQEIRSDFKYDSMMHQQSDQDSRNKEQT